MYLILICTIIIILLLKFLLSSDPVKIHSIYSRPGKWYYLKYFIFWIIIKIRKSKKSPSSNSGYGQKSKNSVEEMEKVQILPLEHPNAVDAVYFNGANKDGMFLIAATARRHDNIVQSILYVKLPNIGLLQLPSLPDTTLIGPHADQYEAGGMIIKSDRPMKTWHISFNGDLRLIKEGDWSTETNLIPVSLDCDWTATSPYFDFDTDLCETAICKAIATECWSRRLFDDLKLAHQTHYEQFGHLTGRLKFEGKDIDLNLYGVRDHSYGNWRDWSDLHRYAIQYAYLEDGTSICVGVICMPRTMSRLVIGYVNHPNEERMDPISSTDFHLENHGENGLDVDDLTINFTAGAIEYTMKVKVKHRPIFYMGRQWEGRIHERMCTYDVNGVPGYGISEWCYRNLKHKEDVTYQLNRPTLLK